MYFLGVSMIASFIIGVRCVDVSMYACDVTLTFSSIESSVSSLCQEGQISSFYIYTMEISLFTSSCRLSARY